MAVRGDAEVQRQPTPELPVVKQRCAGEWKRGYPCRFWAVPGFAYCAAHEETIDAVEKSRLIVEQAREELLRLAPLAVHAAEEIAAEWDGKPEARLKAVAEILDRTGFSRTERVEVRATVEVLGAEALERLTARLEEMELRRSQAIEAQAAPAAARSLSPGPEPAGASDPTGEGEDGL